MSRRPLWYILAADGKTPIPCADLATQGQWREASHAHCHVGDDERDGVRVSTVFLGLDHQWHEGPPVLWETMIFGLDEEDYQELYTSYEDAVAGHARAVAFAFGSGRGVRRGMKLTD